MRKCGGLMIMLQVNLELGYSEITADIVLGHFFSYPFKRKPPKNGQTHSNSLSTFANELFDFV